MTLGETIQYYRKRAGLSQEALAELVGVSRQAVSKWELDEATPEVTKLKALAGAFGITTDQLLSGERPAGPQPEDAPQASTAQESKNSGVELPGLWGVLARRYGWLFGVYVALSGAGIALVGGVARFAFSAMRRTALMDGMGSFGGGGWTVSGDVPPEVLEQMGIQTTSPAAQMLGIPVAVATVILVIGILIAIAGVCLAVFLRRKGRKD